MVLALVAGCAGLIVRGMLRSAAGRRRGACGGCGKCGPPAADKTAAKIASRTVFLPVEHVGRKR